MPAGFDYKKWDNIELSDDEKDDHPNIDKASWHRLKHRNAVEKDEDDEKVRLVLQKKLQQLQKELSVYGEAGKEHLKAKNLQDEIDKVQAELDTLEKNRKWHADNMCKTVDSKTAVSETLVPAPGPEPRLSGEAVAAGYCEFVEEHEELLERYIEMGAEEDLEKVGLFLREHGGVLLQGEHAESYLLLDCLEKEMNDFHAEMRQSARQFQLISQMREWSRASGRPARDSVNPIIQRVLEHDGTRESFEETVNEYAQRVQRRAVVKKKEMDAEMEEERRTMNPLGPGGLDPLEVLDSLPEEMKQAFISKDGDRLQAAVASLSEEDAKYHLKRCEESGLWVPNQEGKHELIIDAVESDSD
mmetsp:Transcript_36115/g.58292  ORF Transcript_36115/g.58292 Transcript_36115/m.58292 type:complete len:358 (+) Transcript_36115:105-1178(+)|eukprot:CAMPEP_0115087200 /NCGR_PEP_ID=MMETSP0227-20121206/23103_1 /TAXON_ID=89957 /ORGANISM="Polarella glacialis, Strain CCMP 1383" /LENGTH=357 /DNA_ID=CAMNT_0002476931 /DNA_START=75 /DNA_END=1148 /DNA_ORIENTATION=+